LKLLLGFGERGFVAFALHRVFGPLVRKSFFMQDATQLVLAKRNPGLLFQVLVQTRCRPDAEAIAQCLRRRIHRLPQRLPILQRCRRNSSRRFATLQTRHTALPIVLADVVHGRGTASQILSERKPPSPAPPPEAKWGS